MGLVGRCKNDTKPERESKGTAGRGFGREQGAEREQGEDRVLEHVRKLTHHRMDDFEGLWTRTRKHPLEEGQKH